jgi:hypothetical protein
VDAPRLGALAAFAGAGAHQVALELRQHFVPYSRHAVSLSPPVCPQKPRLSGGYVRRGIIKLSIDEIYQRHSLDNRQYALHDFAITDILFFEQNI